MNSAISTKLLQTLDLLQARAALYWEMGAGVYALTAVVSVQSPVVLLQKSAGELAGSGGANQANRWILNMQPFLPLRI